MKLNLYPERFFLEGNFFSLQRKFVVQNENEFFPIEKDKYNIYYFSMEKNLF